MAFITNEAQKPKWCSFDPSDLSGLIGKRFVYKYDAGWQYETYVKNSQTVDYRIHSGPLENRWVKNQRTHMVRVGPQMYKVSWTEPTGTDVSLFFNLIDRFVHGTVFFPRWIVDCPKKTVCFQNDAVERMETLREAGPTYPTEVMNEFGRIICVNDCGPDDDSVIACGAKDLPKDFPRPVGVCHRDTISNH